MVLNSLEFGLEVIPHANKQLKVASIPPQIVNRLKKFVIDVDSVIKEICEHQQDYPTIESKKQRLIIFRDERQSIYDSIFNLIGKKSGSLSFTPAEYIEAMYIVTYQLSKYLSFTQDDVSSCLDFNKNMYRDKWGISPVADYNSYHVNYDTKLPIDNNSDILEKLIPMLGAFCAAISSSAEVVVSNNPSIVVNLHTGNRKNMINKKLFMLNDMSGFICFSEMFANFKVFKERVKQIIDTCNVDRGEEFLESILSWGITLSNDNLRRHDKESFDLDYERYLQCIKDKEYFEEAIDNPDYDFDEHFTGSINQKKDGTLPNKEETCRSKIMELDKSIEILLNRLMDDIIVESLITESNVAVLSYLIERYKKHLNNITANDFTDIVKIAAERYVVNYFSNNGVSIYSLKRLKEHLESSDIGTYVTKMQYNSLDYMVMTDGLLSPSIEEVVADLREQISDKKENRTSTTALVYIDAEISDISNSQIQGILQNENISVVIGTPEKREYQGLLRYKLDIDTEYYLYSDIILNRR